MNSHREPAPANEGPREHPILRQGPIPAGGDLVLPWWWQLLILAGNAAVCIGYLAGFLRLAPYDSLIRDLGIGMLLASLAIFGLAMLDDDRRCGLERHLAHCGRRWLLVLSLAAIAAAIAHAVIPAFMPSL